jgi:hypothetical protein
MENFSTCDLITQVVNKLFVYTDLQEWVKLQTEVFTKNVVFDMSSMGGMKSTLSAVEICRTWQVGFVGIDAVNHLSGNYLIEVNENEASVFAYATATHYKKSATKGNTREFVGSYNLHLIKENVGWRIDEFKYTLKYANGNVDFS